MATKKTTKSNKTSHVLNLLTSAPVAEEALHRQMPEGMLPEPQALR